MTHIPGKYCPCCSSVWQIKSYFLWLPLPARIICDGVFLSVLLVWFARYLIKLKTSSLENLPLLVPFMSVPTWFLQALYYMFKDWNIWITKHLVRCDLVKNYQGNRCIALPATGATSLGKLLVPGLNIVWSILFLDNKL